MDALTLLLNRSSQPRLEAPAPSGDALENIMQAALRAPDHACLTPWRFIVCTGKGLDKLVHSMSNPLLKMKSRRKKLNVPCSFLTARLWLS